MTTSWRALFTRHLARFLADGVAYAELAAVKERLLEGSDWTAAFAEGAKGLEESGLEALEAGHTVTAGAHFRQSSLLWHYGHFLDWAAEDRWFAAQFEKSRLYGMASPLLQPPAERLSVPVGDHNVPGNLRKPTASHPPIVILIGGLDSTKEEACEFESLCLQRGLATFAFDGPGQGEFVAQQPMGPGFEEYVQTVLNHLELRGDLDTSRVGIVGRSLGGNYAAKAAVVDPRINACVVWGAPFDSSFWDSLDEDLRIGFRFLTKTSSDEDTLDILTRLLRINSEPIERNLAVLICHGKKDAVVPSEHAERFAKAFSWSPDVTLYTQEEGGHCSHNLANLVRPYLVDWMTDRLAHEASNGF